MCHLNGTVTALHRIAHDAQAQARAAHGTGAGLIHAVEAFENMRLMFLRDADAGVFDGQANLSVGVADGDLDPAAGTVVFDGIFAEIADNL